MKKKPPLKVGDIYPAQVLRDEYGMNAEHRPIIKLNPDEVPEEFITLIPYVERWAIPCDVTRGDYFDKQLGEDIASFYYETLPYIDGINKWIDEQPEDAEAWSEAAVHFLYFLKAHCEAWQPTEDEKRELEKRHQEWAHNFKRQNAIKQSLNAFNKSDYNLVVDLLSPFEDELSKSVRVKLNYSKKKIG